LFADFHNRDLIYTREKYGNKISYGREGLNTIKLNFNTTRIYSPGEDIPDFFGHKVLIQGYTPPVEFYSPDYSNSKLPKQKDFRRTLYWNPELKLDASGKAHVSLYNNSQTTKITIDAAGQTAEGGLLYK
jgi:hypothetical protein